MPSRIPHSLKPYILLGVGLLAASQSGNLVRIGDAPPSAIAAWRLLLASAFMAAVAGRKLGRIARLGALDFSLLLVAGVALSFHLMTWIAAVQATTVANAAIFFAVNPVFTSVAEFLVYRERPHPRLVASIALGLSGVAVIGWTDFSFHPANIYGDLMSVLCAALFSVYFILGRRLRRSLPTPAYAAGLYAVAAVAAFACLAFSGAPVAGYSARNWLCFVLMAVVPTMVGHTLLNHSLLYMTASTVAAATMSEPMIAGAVAYFAWGEAVTPGAAAGYALVCLSVWALVGRVSRGGSRGVSLASIKDRQG